MTTVAVIPARFASTRFPGKPLANDTGKFLIQHVCEQVARCSNIQHVIVATDDERVAAAVDSYGGRSMMTRDDHPSGTDRVGEVAETLGLADDDLVINVQGDEPEINPRDLSTLVASLQQMEPEHGIATLAAPFPKDGPVEGPGSPADPNCVKVVMNLKGFGIYFSRSLIPYPHGTQGRVTNPSAYLMHVGVYGFRAGTLRAITTDLVPGPIEQVESLEQLRWLSHGFSIAVAVVDKSVPGIDTPTDYESFVARYQSHGAAHSLGT
ncbi:MAG: 3-deoxy-manno-octulosonate cytidylyltransferase [Planctomycetota bacterium]|jgi:3-deoxy-manno-octulosonate cytidylyltransferase (CMP-KDO synthetase)